MKSEWSAIFRHPSLLMVLLAIPLIYPPTVSYLYMNDSAYERPTLLIDQDNSALSRSLITALDATKELRIVDRPSTVEKGFDAIKKRKAEVLFFIPSDFSSKIKRGRQGTVKLWVNTANVFTYGSALPGVYAVVGTYNARLNASFLMKNGIPPESAADRVQPLAVDDRLLFHPSAAYGDFVVPGILLIVLQQLMLIGMAFSVGLQRKEGDFAEDHPHPVLYMLGKILGQYVFYLFGLVLILGVFMPSFGWSITSYATTTVLFTLFIVTMTPMVMAVSNLFKDNFASFEYLMFISTPVFLGSGFTWPFDMMPGHVQAVMSIFPATPVLQAFRITSMRQAGVAILEPWLWWMALQFLAWSLLAWFAIRRPWRNFRIGNRPIVHPSEPSAAGVPTEVTK